MTLIKRMLSLLVYSGVFFLATIGAGVYLSLFHKGVMRAAGLNTPSSLLRFFQKILTRKIHRVRFALLFADVSDPLSVPWAQSSDGDLQRLFKLEALGWKPSRPTHWPCFSFLLLCGLLKRIGMLDQVRAVCAHVIDSKTPVWRGMAHWQLADIDHLHARWHDQLRQPIDAGVFTPPARVFAGLFQGVDFFSGGDWAQSAKTHYEAALDDLPECGWIWLQLGHLHRDAKRFQDAHDAYAHAEALIKNPLPPIYKARASFMLTEDRDAYRAAMDALPVSFPGQDAAPFACKVTTMEDRALSGETESVLDPLSYRYEARYLYKGQIHIGENTIEFPAAAVGRFDHVRNVSLSYALVHDRYLLEDTNHLPESFHKMFASRLLDYDADKATLYLDTQKEPVMCDEPVLLLGGSTEDHYFHFLFEALASLCVIEEQQFHPGRRIVFSHKTQPFHRELLALIGAANDIMTLAPGTSAGDVIYRDALQLPCVSQMTIPHPDAIRFLRRKLADPAAKVTPGKRVHLTRNSSRGVESDQQKAFFEFLRQAGFAIIDPGTMTIAQQRAYFSDVEILSAEGGAAVGNLIFCPSETRAIVIAPSTHVFEIWNVLASTLGQTLWMCLEDPATDYPQPFFLWNSMELAVHLPSYASCLTRILQEIETPVQ